MADFSAIIDQLMGMLQRRYQEAPKREEARLSTAHDRALEKMRHQHEYRTDEMDRKARLAEEAKEHEQIRGWQYGTKDLPETAHEREMGKLRLQESGLLERARTKAELHQQGATLRARERNMLEHPYRYDEVGNLIPEKEASGETPPTAMTPDRETSMQGLTEGGPVVRQSVPTNPARMRSWLDAHKDITDPAEKRRALSRLNEQEREVLKSLVGRQEKTSGFRGMPGVRRFDDNGVPGFTNL